LLFSIIAPCLNEENNLPLFLDSLLKQTFQDFELIIVDGFSTDQSLKIIADYMEHLYIKVVFNAQHNLGFLRNLGAYYAEGEIMFHTSVDTFLESELLNKIKQCYTERPELISLAGRTFPLGTSIIAYLGYQFFDFLRFIFTCLFSPVKKYRPSGNFTTVKTKTFHEIDGFPNVPVNEDGLLGQKLDRYAYQNYKSVWFNLNLYVGHRIKKFEEFGVIQTFLFYLYTLRNLFPMFQPLLNPIEKRAASFFQKKPQKQLTFKQLIRQFWDWI